MKINIDKCPVCGTRGSIIKLPQHGRIYYYGTCRNKYCTSNIRTDYYDKPDQAIEEWNRMVRND